jgi:myosin heavy subunit
MLYFI